MQEKYRILYKTRNITYKIKEAKKNINEFLNIVKKPYISFSGGKDSLVMLHLISTINKNIIVFTQADDLDFPEKETYCKNIVSDFGFKKYHYMYSNNSAFEQIDRDEIKGTFSHVYKKFIKKNNPDGYFLGIRKEESKGRRITYYKYGKIYKTKSSNMWTCIPIADWKGMDIFAYIIQNKLKYIDIYNNDLFKRPDQIRFSWYYNPQFNNEGNVIFLKKYYPELFHKLEIKYPQIRNYL